MLGLFLVNIRTPAVTLKSIAAIAYLLIIIRTSIALISKFIKNLKT
ncbi:hypothetical protein SAMN05878482_10531 [Peribacillus simplex]|uniref:Uncharacterized protein n=1 Tax=Peribacillus simplex TaxID=1478 RepID=A0A9X8WLH3_9BACI|nr:hypothetical protein SAMN05878482_10531 [Peribacillus simplex]